MWRRHSKVEEAQMSNVRFVLFRDDRSASSDAVAVVRDSIRSRTGHYSLTEINVHDHPALAEQYNVRTTPTTLLMKNGDIVDRIVGTPTTSLVNILLDTRTAHIPDVAARSSGRSVYLRVYSADRCPARLSTEADTRYAAVRKARRIVEATQNDT